MKKQEIKDTIGSHTKKKQPKGTRYKHTTERKIWEKKNFRKDKKLNGSIEMLFIGFYA